MRDGGRFDTAISTVIDPDGNEVTLHADHTWHEEKHFQCQLKVIGIPDGMSSQMLRVGKGAYKTHDIQDRVRVGDIVVVDYVNLDSSNIYLIEGKFITIVPYGHVFCYIRDGNIVPVGGHILLSKKDQVEEYSSVIIIPEKKVVNETFILEHIGLPLKGCDTFEWGSGGEITVTGNYGEYKVGDQVFVVSHQERIASIFIPSKAV